MAEQLFMERADMAARERVSRDGWVTQPSGITNKDGECMYKF